MPSTVEHYNTSYADRAPGAQRRWPNEELCRFMGRYFFKIPSEQRKAVRILEAGCGTGSNLWMIAREGFDTYGIDFSRESVASSRQLLDEHDLDGEISMGDMTNIRLPEGYFDCVVDVLSSCCLSDAGHEMFLDSARRVLKPGGRLFSFTLGKRSTDWKGPGNVMEPGSPLVYGYENPLRYTSVDELGAELERRGFTVTGAEAVTRTYQRGSVLWEAVVIEAQRH